MLKRTQLPRCPFARADLEDSLFLRCPGYQAAEVVFEVTGVGGVTPALELAAGTSCGHLGLQPGPIDFGFVSACHHPAGPPPVAIIETVGRGGGHPAGAQSPA